MKDLTIEDEYGDALELTLDGELYVSMGNGSCMRPLYAQVQELHAWLGEYLEEMAKEE